MNDEITRRLRVSHVVVQPVLVWDNGQELSPGPQAQPVSVPLSGLAGLADEIITKIAEAESQGTVPATQ